MYNIDSSSFGFASLLASQMRIMQNELRNKRGLPPQCRYGSLPYSFFSHHNFPRWCHKNLSEGPFIWSYLIWNWVIQEYSIIYIFYNFIQIGEWMNINSHIWSKWIRSTTTCDYLYSLFTNLNEIIENVYNWILLYDSISYQVAGIRWKVPLISFYGIIVESCDAKKRIRWLP